ncbi:exodeoxyribonuclease VII small subunit [candidate division KSB1 bacterium]|nr:exodeoxyribonuclease VII small subunit [candidate division KSB1 bacterium]
MKKQTFEQAIRRLEEIAELLDAGEPSLDDSLKLLEEGMALVDFCTQKLATVEKRIQILAKENDEFTLVDQDPE